MGVTFKPPYLKMFNDARVSSACSDVRTCQRVRNNQKIETIRDFRVNATIINKQTLA